MPDQVFYPEVIQDAPFPNEGTGEIPKAETLPSGTVSPTTTPETKIVKKRIAQELIGQSLNTRSKKILQEFELELSGGFQIGDYKDGDTGDVRITPNGITSRNNAGITTMTLDGTTGDAIFAGKIQSGSVITETLQVGNNSIVLSGTDRRMTFYAADGTPQIVIGNVD